MVLSRLDSIVTGYSSEKIAEVAFMRKHYATSVPSIPMPYDLVVSPDREHWHKIQVKTATRGLNAHISRQNGHVYLPILDVDYFAIVHQDSGTVWLLKAADYLGKLSISVRGMEPWVMGSYDPRLPATKPSEGPQQDNLKVAKNVAGRKAPYTLERRLKHVDLVDKPEETPDWAWEAAKGLKAGTSMAVVQTRVGRIAASIRSEIEKLLTILHVKEAKTGQDAPAVKLTTY